MNIETDADYLNAVRVLELNPSKGEKSPHRFRLLSIAEVEKIPPPTFLVDSIIPESSACEIHGPPGGGKTFLALDLALSVASGAAFFGHKCKVGNVVYVIGEGQSGMGARIRAWRAARQMWGEIRFFVVPEPVQLLNPDDVNLFCAALEPLPDSPVLIVLDTLARCFMGGEENSARDMGMAVATVDALKRRTGAAVLLVHHTRKEGDAERGSIALRGGMDTMLSLKGDDDRMTLTCEKQKDAREFAPIEMVLVKSADSMVFSLPGRSIGPSRKTLAVLEVITRDFPDEYPSATEWMSAAARVVSEATFYRVRGELLRTGLVAKVKKPRGHGYAVTPDGTIALASMANAAAAEAAELARADSRNSRDSHANYHASETEHRGSSAGGFLPPSPEGAGGNTPPSPTETSRSASGQLSSFAELSRKSAVDVIVKVDDGDQHRLSESDLADEVLERQAMRLADGPPELDDADYTDPEG